MTRAIHVTAHARQRWIDRVNPRATLDEAAEAIRAHTAACIVAADFRCRTVIVGHYRLILDGLNVVTVLRRGQRTPSHLEPLA